MTAFVALDRTIDRLAVITARVVDEVTNTPPRAHVTARLDRAGATLRVTDDGFLAISGRLERLFLGLPLQITLTAPRYRRYSTTVTITNQTPFPLDLGTIALRPLPVRLEGRVTGEADRQAVAAANLVARKSEKLLLLRTPLYSARTPADSVTMLTLTPGTPVTLTEAAPAGSRTIAVSNASSFSQIVRVGLDEYGVIDSIDGNTVTLRHALRRSYPPGTSIAPITPGPASATTSLRRDADAGDALLAVSDEVGDAAAQIGDEYHDVGLLSDAGGYFAADGIGGVRTFTLETTAPTFTPLDTAVTIDTSKDVNTVSVRLKKP